MKPKACERCGGEFQADELDSNGLCEDCAEEEEAEQEARIKKDDDEEDED